MEVRVPTRTSPPTLDEYFELDANSQERFEYYGDRIVMMAGSSPEHDAISFNLGVLIARAIDGRPCRGFTGNQRIAIPRSKRHFYSDGGFLCGEDPRYETERGVAGLLNPLVLFEVISPSTERKDRREKLDAYSRIETLRHYVMIEQDEARATVLTRNAAGETWRLMTMIGLDAAIDLSAIGAQLSMRWLYKDVAFPPVESDDGAA